MMKDHSNRSRIHIFIVVVCIAAMICCTVGLTFAIGAESVNYIYFDLSAGDVTITGDTYKGFAYKKTDDNTYTKEEINGTIKSGEAYYVYQSYTVNNSPDGYFTEVDSKKTFTLPSRTPVEYNGQSWGDYVTDNKDVDAVIKAWSVATNSEERSATEHRITVTGKVDVAMVIDNLWSSYHKYGTDRTDGGISFYPQAADSKLTIRVKGDNRFGNIFYCNTHDKTTLTFEEYESGSTLTVADFEGKNNYNYWNSAIGASDFGDYQDAKGLIFNSGTIFAGTTESDDCTAIGGGGNGYGRITINGGRITASVTSSGAAIGGGIGKTNKGGQADVTITGGEVYAYNASCESGRYSHNSKYIPSAAIGGGSSAQAICNSCTVTITGGKVYAESVGGTAIGGGSSADTHGGEATVTIKGNAYVVAKSIAGNIAGESVPAGAAIGGGTGGKNSGSNGGNVILTISDTATVIAGSIGGGKTNSTDGKTGSATVKIDGGTLQGQIVMAAGSSTKCSFTMTGGKLDNSKLDPEFVFLQSDGGAVWMDDPSGEASFSGGSITGCSATNGGAIYMTAGTFTLSGTGMISSCSAVNGGAVYMGGGKFNMQNGNISSCSATNGGAVYMGDGEFDMQNGNISSCSATSDGGGAYLGGGILTVSGGKISANKAEKGAGTYLTNGTMTISDGEISNNTAQSDGGGAYLGGGTLTVSGGKISANKAENGAGAFIANGDIKVLKGTISNNIASQNGGAFSVSNGSYTMTGGIVSGNKAISGDGGAVYISSSQETKIHIRSGEVTGNSSGKSGGALAVKGVGNAPFTVLIGSNTDHSNRDHCHACEGTDTNESCPIIKNNTSTVSGGGIYLTGSNSAQLNIYCVVEGDNKVGNGSTSSDFMMVDGGTLNIDTQGTDTQSHNGNVEINSTIYVTGGKVTIAGDYDDTIFNSPIKVDVDGVNATFEDKRIGDSYTIQYFENYYENGVYSGQYFLIDGEKGGIHTVKSSLYSHTGYEIDGWTLKKDGQLYTAGDEIKANENLVFYAKWSVVGYTVVFKPGVESYQGEMSAQNFAYTDTKKLTKNAFTNVGFDFVCWVDESDAEKKYNDEAEVSKLTSTHGATITLVATWKICEHNDSNYTITSTSSSVSRQCHCLGYSETVSLSNINVVYDGSRHHLKIVYKYESLNEKTPTSQWKDFPVKYSGTDNDGNTISSSSAPTNAGNYTGSVTIDNTTITANITIARADYQTMPNTPTYEVTKDANDNNIIQIQNPNDTTNPLEYLFSWYEGSELKTGGWQKVNGTAYPSQTLDKSYTNYYVDVRYAQTCNYNASASVRGASSVMWTGNVTFMFSTDTGLNYSYSTNTNSEGITIILTPVDGYYIYRVEHTLSHNGGNGYTAPTLTDQDKTGTQWKVWITNIQEAPNETSVTIDIKFSGAEKKAIVSSAVVKDEVFDDISFKSEDDVTISRDSAFTVYFAVNNLKHYTDPSITFNQFLPVGSTVIMRDQTDNSYWSYKVDTSTNKIKLTDFVRMGSRNDKYAVVDKTSLKLQFVIDFSDCTTDTLLSTGSLSVSFTATAENPDDLNTVPELPSGNKIVTLAQTPTFSIDHGTSDGLSCSISYKFAYVLSNVGISKWDVTGGILCLTPKEDMTLPADVRLQVKIGNSTVIYPLINGKFTVILNTIGEGSAELTLLSNMLPNEDKTMKFAIVMYASATNIGTAPNERVCTGNVVIYTVKKIEEYAIKAEISGTFPEYRKVENGNDTVSSIDFKGDISDALPSGYTVKVSLYYKDPKGDYVSTSASQTIGNINNKMFYGSFALESMRANMENNIGSLSMMLKFEIIDANSKVVDSVPLYFILIDTRE